MRPFYVETLRRCGVTLAAQLPPAPSRLLLLDGSAWLRAQPKGHLQTDLIDAVAARYTAAATTTTTGDPKTPTTMAVLALDTAAALPLHVPLSETACVTERAWNLMHTIPATSLALIPPGTLDTSPLLQWQWLRTLPHTLRLPPQLDQLRALGVVSPASLDAGALQSLHTRVHARLSRLSTWAALDVVARDRLVLRMVAQEITASDSVHFRVATWTRHGAVPYLEEEPARLPAESLAKLWVYAVAALQQQHHHQVVLVSPRSDALVHALALVTVVLDGGVRPGCFWLEVPLRGGGTAVVDLGLLHACLHQVMTAAAAHQVRPVALWCFMAMLGGHDLDLALALWDGLSTVPAVLHPGRFQLDAAGRPPVSMDEGVALQWYQHACYIRVPAFSGHRGNHNGLQEWTSCRAVHGLAAIVPPPETWVRHLQVALTEALNVLPLAWYVGAHYFLVDLHKGGKTGFAIVPVHQHAPSDLETVLAQCHAPGTHHHHRRHQSGRIRPRFEIRSAESDVVLLMIAGCV